MARLYGAPGLTVNEALVPVREGWGGRRSTALKCG